MTLKGNVKKSIDLDSSLSVLLVNKAYLPVVGGVEKVVEGIARGLQGKEITVSVLACRETRGPTYMQEINGVTVIYAGTFGTFMSLPISLSFFWWFFVLRHKFAIVHWHEPFPLATLASFFLPKRRGVVTFHSDIVRQRMFARAVGWLQRKAFDRCGAVVSTSSLLARNSTVLSKMSCPIDAIPIGIELDRSCLNTKKLDAWRQEFAHLGPFVLAVGRLVYYKGFDVLVAAAARCNARIVIIGRGPLERDLRQQIAALSLEHRVTLITEPVDDDDLAIWFAACEFFVLPSTERSEAYGIVQLEAMAAGKPVVNTRLATGVPYVSLDGVTGLTVEPRDADGLASAIDTLWEDSTLRQRLAIQARQRVEESFSHETMVEKYLVVYRRLTAQSTV